MLSRGTRLHQKLSRAWQIHGPLRHGGIIHIPWRCSPGHPTRESRVCRQGGGDGWGSAPPHAAARLRRLRGGQASKRKPQRQGTAAHRRAGEQGSRPRTQGLHQADQMPSVVRGGWVGQGGVTGITLGGARQGACSGPWWASSSVSCRVVSCHLISSGPQGAWVLASAVCKRRGRGCGRLLASIGWSPGHAQAGAGAAAPRHCPPARLSWPAPAPMRAT
jgi:hypothetical protein